MEASRRPRSSVAEKLADFKARYPRDKYIWVNAPLETADDWPEHFGLGARCFKVPTDNLAGTPKQNGWIYELYAKFALMAPAWRMLAQDAGIVFARELYKRIDDGSDPDLCDMEASAALLTLSGLHPVNARKKIDRRICGKVSREFLIENCETKLELRLIRKLIPIPQAFTLEELQKKEFVTFCVFSSPNAQTEQERLIVLQHHLGIYGPAFGQAMPIHIGSVEAPLQLGAPRRSAVEVAGEIDAVEDDDPVGFDEIPPPASDPAPAPEETKRAPLDPEFLKAVGVQKRELYVLLGREGGAAVYYEVLGGLGYAHANAVAEPTHKKLIYRGLESRIKTVKAEAAAKQPELPAEQKPAKPLELTEPGNSLETFLATRRRSLARMSMERIAAELDDMLEDYPVKTDPEKIMPRIKQPKDKDDLIEVMMLLTRRSLDENSQIRERHNSTRGGER